MPVIRLVNVTKKFGNFVAVDNLNMTIQDGDFVSLLGPSGCGKTTTLRMIAGLETPTEGEIYIDDTLVFSEEKGINLSPDKRNVGFLFQNYALWPHMTVYKNIAFGLENMKWKKEDIDKRVNELLKTLQIEEFRGRYPAELSGGQQQRVAIARTLATNPAILLMDEPLSNLDAKLRNGMRAELKRLHATSNSTFVYVTHDQSEAMTLSTRVCLMDRGVLQQYCPPLELYGEPTNLFVADFMGNPTMNFVDVKARKSENGIELTCPSMNLTFHPLKETEINEADDYVLGLRPEAVLIQEDGQIEGTVISSLPSGMETTLSIEVKDIRLSSVVFGNIDFAMDSKVNLTFKGNTYILFNKRTRNKVGMGALTIK